jgi:hypothetical protein
LFWGVVRSPGEKTKTPGQSGWLGFVTAVAGVAFVWFLWYWNLIGYQF